MLVLSLSNLNNSVSLAFSSALDDIPSKEIIFVDCTLEIILFGLDRIYTKEEIEKARASPSFEREYNLKYLGLIGNVFHTNDIDAAIQRGKGYNPDSVVNMSGKSIGIDPAYGSSNFGIVATQDMQIFYIYINCPFWVPYQDPKR